MDELAWVLEKKEQDKLTLLNYLTTRSDSFFPIKRILTSLGWSRYRTLSTITMLLDDLETYFPNEPTAYAYDEKQKAVTVNRAVLVDVKTVAFDYRQKSVIWQLLGVIFTGTFESYEQFAETFHTSVPIARAAKSKIATVLKQANIKLTLHNGLVGNETTIRIFFFGLMRQAYGNHEIPFPPEMRERTEQAVLAIANLFNIPLRETTKQAMRMQFTIWYYRLINDHHLLPEEIPTLLTDSAKWDAEHQATRAGLIELMGSFVSLPKAVVEREADFAIASLYSTGFASSVPVSLLTEVAQKKLARFKMIVKTEYQVLFNQELSERILNRVTSQLSATNMRTAYFSVYGYRPTPDLEIAHRDFPIHTAFVLRVLHHLAEKIGFDEQVLVNSLFEEYLDAMIRNLSKHAILPAVVVVIDMTNLPALEELIQDRLKRSPMINVIVAHEFRPDTDFYISDVEISQFGVTPGFIWTRYPDETMFAQFIEQAVLLTKDRFKGQ